MANRVLIGIAVVALALLGAGWFASGSPSRGSGGVLPAEVEVAATEAGTGSWVRYLVTLKNAGDTEFRGQVVLLNRAPAVASPGLPAALPPLPSAVPRFPASAPDAAYEVHLTVSPRQSRTFALVAPDRYATVAVTQDPDGSTVASAIVDRSAYAPVAVLGAVPEVLDQLQGVHFDDLVLRVTDYPAARSVPSSALGYAPYSAVVVDGFDVGTLTEAQRTALRDYVGQGGALVVAGGAQWRRTLGRLPSELAVLLPTATASEGLGTVLALSGRAGDPVAAVATGTLAAGARPVAVAADGRPLVAELPYGQGITVALAFDPAAEPAGSVVPGAAWSEAVGRVLNHTAGQPPGAETVPGVSLSTATEFPALRPASLPSPWLVGPLLLLYLVVVAPVSYVLLRRRFGNGDRLWLTAPLVALLFTGAFYGLGTALQAPLTDEQLQVLKLGSGSAVAEMDYHRIVFRQRGDHVLDTLRPALAAPLTYDLTAASSAMCGDACTLPLAGLRSGAEHVVPAVQPQVLERDVVYGGVRVLGVASTGHAPLGLESHLRLAGGRVSGRLANTGDRALTGTVLYWIGGGGYQRATLGPIEAHSSVMVDTAAESWDGDPNARLPGSRIAADAPTRLSRAVGLSVLTASGSAWLVGFTDPLPGTLRVDGALPRQAALTVFEAPAHFDGVDGAVGDFATRRLAASSGDRAHGGLVDVYDLELPGQLPPALTISYDRNQASQVEVYDWGARDWQAGGWEDDAHNLSRLTQALRGSQLQASPDGSSALVRVRIHEPRISWGRQVFLAEAA